MSNLESKTLKQILDESNIAYSFKGWAGDSQLILNQKYVAEVFVQKEIATLTFEATLSPSFFRAKCKVLTVENTQLKQQIESANKLLDEKIKAWDEAYSLEANDLQWAASVDLEAVKTILFPRKENQGVE